MAGTGPEVHMATTKEEDRQSGEHRASRPRQATEPRLPAVRSSAAPTAPARWRRALLRAFGLLVAVAAGLGLFFKPWAGGRVPVTVELVEEAPATQVLAVNGRIAARQSVDVRALVGGTLSEVRVTEGDMVQAGDVLARIDSTGQSAALRQAVAVLDAALVAEARARDALGRAEALGGNIARTERDAAERGLLTAMQEVARASAQVDEAQAQLENFTLHSPMDGTVLALNVEPGQTIDQATVLMTIADLERLVVETDVDETYATRIREGQPAMLQLAGERATRLGQVSFVSQRVDAGTGGLGVELSFDEPVAAPVGLTVTTNIIVDERSAAITAPRTAIDGGDAVFVVVDGIAQRREVSVIDWPAARLIVTEGLVPGDVLVSDAAGLTAGQAVRIERP